MIAHGKLLTKKECTSVDQADTQRPGTFPVKSPKDPNVRDLRVIQIDDLIIKLILEAIAFA